MQQTKKQRNRQTKKQRKKQRPKEKKNTEEGGGKEKIKNDLGATVRWGETQRKMPTQWSNLTVKQSFRP